MVRAVVDLYLRCPGWDSILGYVLPPWRKRGKSPLASRLLWLKCAVLISIRICVDLLSFVSNGYSVVEHLAADQEGHRFKSLFECCFGYESLLHKNTTMIISVSVGKGYVLYPYVYQCVESLVSLLHYSVRYTANRVPESGYITWSWRLT